jgi:hypothetical protein
MAKKSVFCIASNDGQAIEIVQQLKSAGFHYQDISVLFPDKQGTRDFAHQQQTKAPEAAVAGAGTGGVLGAALGWLAGLGALAIPGAGPFIAAGPLMAALSGAAVGATIGGITGALVGMGIPEYEAKRYEGKIRSGNILISVHSETQSDADKARAIFERAGAQDISSTSEAALPARATRDRKTAETEPAEPKSRTTKTKGPSASLGAPVAPPSATRSPSMSEPTREEIAARAYQNYLKKGRPEGQDMQNWLEAEAQLRTERQQRARATTARR